MKRPNAIAVDPSKHTPNRWNSRNWLQVDLARITEVSGPLPINHHKNKGKGRSDSFTAFARWLDDVVAPETLEFIMSDEKAFSMIWTAFQNLANHQANMKQPSNRESQKTTESAPNGK